MKTIVQQNLWVILLLDSKSLNIQILFPIIPSIIYIYIYCSYCTEEKWWRIYLENFHLEIDCKFHK